jgi:hypothetical protein
MEQRPRQVYLCPMHPEVRQPNSGKCPKCGMELLPEGTRFAMLRHMLTSPWLLIIMVVVMVALMAVPVLF